MATYPVEFHRRLEQKWESRIEQILSVTGTVPPPRRPNADDQTVAGPQSCLGFWKRGAQNRRKERHLVDARRHLSDQLFQAIIQ